MFRRRVASDAAIFQAIDREDYDEIRAIAHRDKSMLNVEDVFEDTPLEHAASRGDEKCVKLLIELGAYFDPKASVTDDMVAHAISTRKLHIAETFFRLGWRPSLNNFPTYLGTPTEVAIKQIYTYEDFMRLYRNGILDVTYTSDMPERRLFLHIAVERGHAPIVRALLEVNPALAHTRNGRGELPIHAAAIRKPEEIMVLLARAAPETLDAFDNFGIAPIHKAAQCKAGNLVRLLHRFGSDVYHLTRRAAYPPFSFPVYRRYAYLRSLAEVLFLCE